MGQLIAWHYRTTLLAKLADHTYVTCGNLSKAWGCWGGKTGGAVLRQGAGSTAQADAIANPDERAGISCYLINGVCHQAANRVLFPAGITVRGARGYPVSEALFGAYGRPRALFGLCKAPFHKHAGVSGDIAECAVTKRAFSSLEKRILEVAGDDRDENNRQYLSTVAEIYDKLTKDAETLSAEDTRGFHLALFKLMVEFKLGESDAWNALAEIRMSTEDRRLEVENLFEIKELPVGEFVRQSNDLDERFQEDIANTLSEQDYQALFELERGDIVVLGDPEIADKYYTDMPPPSEGQ
ncbi:MAG: hypothetical protein KZQ76_11870 [Candidatus Thiodiazotropha sp. (ex Epidulcina cf. delphinae)]|nr:hypothetical protein [Candidatus Thiodiazotropha sp. (ex Epidulcina cf. delphinae)]